jgi:tetratricopeptide (TPR) repeat protein
MNPTGKPEDIQSSVGFYFTDIPPTNTLCKMALKSFLLDIPPGATNYLVEDSFELPADCRVVGVLPHAHYLAREMQGFATLPNGSRQWLLWIRNWDFNWQGNYWYRQPVFLPKGTKLGLRYRYDNSAGNIRNPRNPPVRVGYGPQSSDEMCELWFQLLFANAKDKLAFEKAARAKGLKDLYAEADFQIRREPSDPKGYLEKGRLKTGEGRIDEALPYFRAAVRVGPDSEAAHYDLAVVLEREGGLEEAEREFNAALKLSPEDGRAAGGLGEISLRKGDVKSAEQHFREALRCNPDDTAAKEYLLKLKEQPEGGRPTG